MHKTLGSIPQHCKKEKEGEGEDIKVMQLSKLKRKLVGELQEKVLETDYGVLPMDSLPPSKLGNILNGKP
jgi:hypothetical protein